MCFNSTPQYINWQTGELLEADSSTHCPLGDVAVIFKFTIRNSSLSTHCEITLRRKLQNTANDKSINIGSGNGLVPIGNKPLSEPMLTQIYIAI